MSFRGVILFIALTWGGALQAQEVKYIDISNVSSAHGIAGSSSAAAGL